MLGSSWVVAYQKTTTPPGWVVGHEVSSTLHHAIVEGASFDIYKDSIFLMSRQILEYKLLRPKLLCADAGADVCSGG